MFLNLGDLLTLRWGLTSLSHPQSLIACGGDQNSPILILSYSV